MSTAPGNLDLAEAYARDSRDLDNYDLEVRQQFATVSIAHSLIAIAKLLGR